MDKKTRDALDGLTIGDVTNNFKKLDTRAPAGHKQHTHGMAIEAVVDNKPQELNKLRPFAVLMKDTPALLPAEGQIVIGALFDCFTKAGNMQEGQIHDLVWGFEQCGIPAAATFKGIQDLQKQGYIKLENPDGTAVSVLAQPDKVWVRYTRKLMELCYEKKD